MRTLQLQDDRLIAGFDRQTGALVELTDRASGWQFILRPELGLPFAWVVPLADRLNHRVLGEQQKAPSIKVDEAPSRLQFTWQNLISETGQQIDASFSGSVELTDFGLRFDGEVLNRSPFMIDNVAWPIIGELAPRSPGGRLERFTASWSEANRTSLSPSFKNEQGYWGTDHPMQKAHSPHQPFLLICDERGGLYVGHHDIDDRELLQFLLELKPGVQNTLTDLVPVGGTISGQPVRVQMTLQHFTFVAPGQTSKLSPVVLLPYSGSWHKGADCYKKWRATWHRAAPTPGWCREIHSWQQVQINSIAGEQRCRYDRIIGHAEQCAKHGVETIQLTGWTRNGQDGWLPSHDTDSRLGTWDDLKSAIARCRELGVRVVLYGKFIYADVGTPQYSKLCNCISMDRAGNPTGHAGWAYFLPSHFAEVNMRRLNYACMNHPRWREVCCDEYRRSLDLDADGWLLDETCHPRQDGRFCFAADHGHEVPAFNCAGDSALMDEIDQIAAQHPREQLISCEAAHDKNTAQFGLSYFRIFSGHIPLLRYIDPHYPMLVGLWGFDDREKINMCLMYRYLISYEPLNFKGRLDDFPLTVEYGKKVDALRKRYRAQLWDSIFQDTIGASVTISGQVHEAYAVYRQPQTGRQSLVVANHNPTESIEVAIAIEDADGALTAVTPEHPEPARLRGPLVVPPRSVAVVFQSV